MWNKTLGALFVIGSLAACSSPADTSTSDANAESTEDDLTAKKSQSLDTLRGAIAADAEQGIGDDPVKGRLIHKCSSRGASQRVYFDVYMTEHKIEDSPGVVVIRSRGVTHSVLVTIDLAIDSGTTYDADDVYIEMQGVNFHLSTADDDGYSFFQGAFFDQATLVCTKGPESLPMGVLK